ncbi:hypothetical protein ACFWDN_21175 [Micromonospora chalcea]
MPEPTGNAPETSTETAPPGAPAGTEGTPTEPGTAPTTLPAVNLDGPYDAERGTRLIANLRAELEAEKAKRRSGEPAEDVAAMKAQLDAITAELAKTRTQAVEAAKTAAIAEAKVPAHLAGYVTGSTPEEIKASAEKVAADFAAGRSAEADPLPGLPKPALTSGRASADAAPAFDPVATARAARGY